MKVKTLEAQAYDLMREKIITGEWPQGMHLKDNEIAAPLGISATPVREALRKLASEGLVETIPYRGTFVTTISPEQIQDLFDVRLGLELTALECGLRTITDTDLGEMETAIVAFDRALERQALTAMIDADMTFHNLLVRSSRNQILIEFYRQLAGRVQMLMAIADLSGRMASGNFDHREILEAMRRGHLQGAQAAVRKHLCATRDTLLSVVEKSPHKE